MREIDQNRFCRVVLRINIAKNSTVAADGPTGPPVQSIAPPILRGGAVVSPFVVISAEQESFLPEPFQLQREAEHRKALQGAATAQQWVARPVRRITACLAAQQSFRT